MEEGLYLWILNLDPGRVDVCIHTECKINMY